MPARSPHRRSPVPAPPAPPRISRRTPPLPMKRGRSLERRGTSSGPGPSRRREFREGSPPSRRSRSPGRRGGPPKGPPVRDFPDSKRKLSPPPPKKNRREERRPIGSPEIKQTSVRGKSPISRDRGPRPFGEASGSAGGYSSALDDNQGRLTRTIGSGDRFRGGADYDEESALDRPIFRGPEGTVRFDPNELKRISVEIVRRNLLPPESQVINRAIVNPEDITPVRRPEVNYGDQMNQSPRSRMRDTSHHAPHHGNPNDVRPPSPPPWEWPRHSSTVDSYNQRDHVGYPNRERSRIRSPGPSREPHGFSYSERERERERSPYDSRPHPRELLDSREKRGDRYQSRDDLRHELDQRRRDDPPPPPPNYRSSEYRESSGGYSRPRDNESDLRARIAEKRGDLHYRHDERDRERDRDRERERHEMERHRSHRTSPLPPPPRDRRRGSPEVGLPHNEREIRDRELWQREREREREREGADRKRRGRSREREPERRGGGGSGRRHSLDRFPEPSSDKKERSFSKPDYDYEHPGDKEVYERDDFISSNRGGGRGGSSIRRPPLHPGPRGMPHRFNVGMRPVMPRVPAFIPVRGPFRPHMPRVFPPRIGFFPPPFRPFFM